MIHFDVGYDSHGKRLMKENINFMDDRAGNDICIGKVACMEFWWKCVL